MICGTTTEPFGKHGLDKERSNRLEDRRRVLVVGAGGFIGSRLTDALLRQGYYVDAVVRDKGKKTGILEKLRYIESDIMDLCVNKSCFSESYRQIYYLAWEGTKKDSKNDYRIQSWNMNYLCSFFDFCRHIHTEKLVLMGSAMEYGAENGTLDPSLFPKAIDTYSAFKAAGRVLTEFFCRKYQIPYNYVISATVYGESEAYENILSYAIKALLLGERTLFTDLKQVWNYIYIDDLTEGLIRTARYGKIGQTYILSGNENRPLSEYIERIRDKIDPKATLGIGELSYKMEQGEMVQLDSEQTFKEIGFQPKVDFDEGIERTIAFFKAQMKEKDSR